MTIIEEILEERRRQDEKWGVQNHKIVTDTVPHELLMTYYSLPREERAKKNCDTATKEGILTWGDIIVEELVEALNAKDYKDMRTELVQCGAVILAMIESLDRNGK